VTDCQNRTKNQDAICTAHKREKKKPLHTRDWIGRLIPPNYTREDCSTDVLPHTQINEALIQWLRKQPGREAVTDAFVLDFMTRLYSNIPDATTLQNNYEEKSAGMVPDEFVKLINDVVDKHFPKSKYGSERVHLGKFKNKSLDDMPLRILAALLVLAVGCEESNRGDANFCKSNNRKSKYANVYMPTAYYFLRRQTNATPEQAKMCLKG
jgi:hypothetical protein